MQTLWKNTTKATDAQVKAVEDYIDKTARASGTADDVLRPSLDRLLRSTQDITKAQKLQTLALDIAAGTGKDLATVSEALGKAYDGNLGALKRIGVPLDENIVKTKDFDAAVIALFNSSLVIFSLLDPKDGRKCSQSSRMHRQRFFRCS